MVFGLLLVVPHGPSQALGEPPESGVLYGQYEHSAGGEAPASLGMYAVSEIKLGIHLGNTHSRVAVRRGAAHPVELLTDLPDDSSASFGGTHEKLLGSMQLGSGWLIPSCVAFPAAAAEAAAEAHVGEGTGSHQPEALPEERRQNKLEPAGEQLKASVAADTDANIGGLRSGAAAVAGRAEQQAEEDEETREAREAREAALASGFGGTAAWRYATVAPGRVVCDVMTLVNARR